MLKPLALLRHRHAARAQQRVLGCTAPLASKESCSELPVIAGTECLPELHLKTGHWVFPVYLNHPFEALCAEKGRVQAKGCGWREQSQSKSPS